MMSRHGARGRRAAVSALLAGAAVVSLCLNVPLQRLLTPHEGHSPALAFAPQYSTRHDILPRRGDLSTRATGFTAARDVVEVAAPDGGWPTLSVVVLGSEDKVASLFALQQLGLQDYPVDRLAEVVVFGAAELAADAPAALRPLLRELGKGSLSKEFEACKGKLVAVWGDDQVSLPSRLRKQVAAAAGSKANVLRPKWFYDADDNDFVKIVQHAGAGQKDMPQSLQLLLSADSMTLCGEREALVEACANATFADSLAPSSPVEELRDILLSVRPRLASLDWVSVQAPPDASRYEVAKPGGKLAAAVQAAFKHSRGKSKAEAFSSVLKEIQQKRLKPAEAINRLLSLHVKGPVMRKDLVQIRKAVEGSLAKATSSGIVAAVREMLTWPALVPGKGTHAEARRFPVFWAVFQAVRSVMVDAADLMDMVSICDVAQGLVQLSGNVWAMDPVMQDALVKAIGAEIIPNDRVTEHSRTTADHVGTLGLRDCMDALATNALDMPGPKAPVSSLVALAWAMGQASVNNPGLQLKLAQGIIGQVDKLMPQDIGRLFVTLHERKWFKDENTIAYLTETMRSRVQTLKKEDPGLRRILAESAR